MISALKQKLQKKKGFTLAELLIVVAIIGVLVAIAIPIFTGVQSEADTAVMNANLRAARAEASVDYLLNDRTGDQVYTFTVSTSGQITITGPTAGSGTESCTKATDGSYSGTVVISGTSYGS